MKTAIAMVAVLLACTVPASSGDQKFEAEWKTELSLSDIGSGDLNRSYEQVIDYLLPRSRSNASAAYAIVLRFHTSGRPEHQLNIAVSRDESRPTISAWSLELPFELGTRLTSSDVARELASDTHVIKKHLRPSQEFERLVTEGLRKGLSTQLHNGIVIHGDTYDLWAESDGSVLQVHQTPGRSRDELEQWMDKMWAAAQKLSFAR